MQSKIFTPQTLTTTITFTNPLCFVFGLWIIVLFFPCASIFIEALKSGILEILSICIAFLMFGVLPYILCVEFFKARWRAVTFELKEKEIKETSTFLGFAEKTLQYKNIKQVELTQGLIQRALDIGDVVVTTQATAQHADIQLFNLKEYKEVYEFLLAKLSQNDAA